jgi:DNA-binding beta-propeller fold protein YncE
MRLDFRVLCEVLMPRPASVRSASDKKVTSTGADTDTDTDIDIDTDTAAAETECGDGQSVCHTQSVTALHRFGLSKIFEPRLLFLIQDFLHATIPLACVESVTDIDAFILTRAHKHSQWAHRRVRPDDVGALLAGRPESVCVSSTGDIFVCEANRLPKVGQIRMYSMTTSGGSDSQSQSDSKAYSLMRIIGSYGTGRGKFRHPADATFDPNGNLLVVDRSNSTLQVFDSVNYEFSHVLIDKKQLKNPYSIAVGRYGSLVVADSQSRVQVFSSTGEFLRCLDLRIDQDTKHASPSDSPIPVFATAGCKLTDVRSISIDDRDHVYVAGGRWKCVQIFDLHTGIYLRSIGLKNMVPTCPVRVRDNEIQLLEYWRKWPQAYQDMYSHPLEQKLIDKPPEFVMEQVDKICNFPTSCLQGTEATSVAVSSSGHVAIAMCDYVLMYNAAGELLWTWPPQQQHVNMFTARYQDSLRQGNRLMLENANDIAFSPLGELIVTDYKHKRVVMLCARKVQDGQNIDSENDRLLRRQAQFELALQRLEANGVMRWSFDALSVS